MGFLRFSEVINLGISDIILKKNRIGLFSLEKEKHLFPLKLFRKCIDTAKLNESEEKNIFRKIYHSKEKINKNTLIKPLATQQSKKTRNSENRIR